MRFPSESRTRFSSGWRAYLLAVAFTGIAVGVRGLLDPWLGDHVPLVTLFAGVAATVWLGGYGPAVLATVLGYLACHSLFIEPRGSFGSLTVPAVVGALAYVLTCSIIIAFGNALRAAKLRAQEQRRWLETTLTSIGDAVITTDVQGRILSLNPVAATLTGWSQQDAAGRPLEDVFRILHESTRAPVASPAVRAMREGVVVGLANHTILVAKDGSERAIDDSAAPIRDESGEVTGCVLVFRDIATRRAAEQLLSRSERELSDFFENASVGLHWVGPDGIILRANRAELELLGYAPGEYVGHHVTEFHADKQAIADILRRLAAGETLRNVPARMIRRDGTLRDVLIDSYVLWEDGRFIHSRCFTRDVTDVRRAAADQARLAAIVAASDDAIVSKTLDGVIRSWNASAERIFGYTAAEAVGSSINMLIPPELLGEERSILARLQQGERIDHFETVRVTKDGRRIDISLTVSPVRDESGRILGASKIVRDITDRKQAAERMRESEARFRMLADSASVLLWMTDDTGAGFANRAYLDYIGLPHDTDVRDHDWTERIHAEDRDAVLAAFDDCQSRRAPFAATFRFRRHDGSDRWLHCTGVPRVSASGELFGYTACMLDIHDARMAEAALREADGRKDEFLATLAHELRNPLAPLVNMLEVLQRTDGDPALQARACAMMQRQLASLVRLVDDLLDLSRITRNRLEVRRERVELGAILEQALETSRPLVATLGHELTVTLPPAPLHVHGDPVRLAQVFNNLINNAAKYTEPPGRLGVTVERDGAEVVLSVRDSGIGIPAAELTSIFDMFTQGEGSIDRAQGGLGIGLTLVQRLVEMHGGTVRAQSEGPGRGSEFVVRLPLAAPPAAAPAPAAGDREREPALHPLRILIADDNHDAAESLAALLRLSGAETHTAGDGLEAVEAAERLRPEVVLMDLGMPKLDGFAAARRLRAQEWGRAIFLVALTGWGQERDRARTRDAGFDEHLVKPVDHRVLARLLASLVRDRRG